MHSLKKLISKVFKKGMYEYCNIEAIDDPYTFVNKSGGLMSIIQISGCREIIGANAITPVVEGLSDKLSGVLKEPGHKLQFVFERDSRRSRREVEKNINPLRRTMRNIGMNLNSLLDERVDIFSKKIASEKLFLVIYTNTECLTKYDHKNSSNERLETAKKTKLGLKPGEFAQSPSMVFASLRERHDSFVKNIVSKFSMHLELEVLEVHKALREVRKCIDYDHTADEWSPILLGDTVKPRFIKESGFETDISHIMHPDISYQLFSQRPEVAEEDSSLVKMGGKYFAPIIIDIQQRTASPFSELFSSIHINIPWRLSIMFETGHKKVQSKIGNKLTMASLLAWTNSQNKLIKSACEEIIQYAQASTNTLMYSQITACTWGDDIHEVRRNKSNIYQQLQSWGNMDLCDEQGDSIQAWVDTLPGVSEHHVATKSPIFLADALYMLPLSRPCSPWDSGSLLLRTVDSKLFPYNPFSALQTAWSEIVFAPPGYGKSFYSSASNLSLILREGNKQLPRITIIDIGYSSKMFIELVRQSLPEKDKHLAQAYKLQNTKSFAINPFDTPLGCQFPISIDKEFVVNFVTLALTPAGQKEPISRLAELVRFLVEGMYERLSESGTPNPYELGADPVVDKCLEELMISCNENTTWWKVTKRLFDKGRHYEAIRAQRFAVPCFSDATGVLASDQNIADTFRSAVLPSGESLLEYVKGMLLSLTKEFPILSCPTVFDVGAARMISFDLASVAQGGSDQANKRTAMLYMLATNIGTREFYRHVDQLPEYPADYAEYHKREIEKEAQTPKKLVMDEYHKTKGQLGLRNQTLAFIREGRKFQVSVSVLSQLMDDFDDDMIKSVNNIIVLSPGVSEEEAKSIKERFGMSEDTFRYMKRYVTGPDQKEGSSMIYIGTLKGRRNGKLEQCLRLTLGPREVWAYSTVHEDVFIRNYLVEMHGLDVALTVLATQFPDGSAKPFLNSYTDKELDKDDADENEFRTVAHKIYEEYRRNHKRVA
ncbi:ATP-binding protein [Pseudomonas luteola]